MPYTERTAVGETRSDQITGTASRALDSKVRIDRLEDSSVSDPALFDLFEQITLWLQSGETVDAEQLASEYPAWAQEIRTLLPTLREMARARELENDDHASAPAHEGDLDVRRAVGEFMIVREIGRGGMGIVYEAEQPELGRRVALKILPSAAALDPRAIQRFQLEAQVAGWLQHPRIVPVYAVGMASGIPYFAMQLIEGGSLAGLIAELRALLERTPGLAAVHTTGDSPSALARGLLSGRFSPSMRVAEPARDPSAVVISRDEPRTKAVPSIGGAAYLRTVARLGIQAAEALGHAHEQGIIHRDVKPANLLLDRRGDLWVADFGMADVQGESGLTLSGDLPGTLRYMSPEQATGQRALVDRRTDIYSLGATLYELLTLQPAIAGSDKAEIIRRIAEDEPTPIRRLNPAVPVDLATIVTKALSKSPASRYETAMKLADELARFLEGRPIAARPVGPVRRSWRWCRRKPVLASLIAALIFALIGGVGGIAWNWREAVRQKGIALDSQSRAEASEKKALTQAAKADAINRFLIEKILRQAAPENNAVNKRVTLLEVLDRAATEVGSSFRDQPQIEAAIRLAIGLTYHDLGDYSKSEAHTRAAYEILSRTPDESTQYRVTAMAELGHTLVHLDRLEEAEPLLNKAIDESRRAEGWTSEAGLKSTDHLASLYRRTHRTDKAESLYQRLVDHYRLARGPNHPDTLTAINNLGVVLENEGKYPEAERLFRECLERRHEANGPLDPGTLVAQFNLGYVLSDLGRYDEAELLIRQCLEARKQVLGAEHPDTLCSMSELGMLMRKRGRLDEAESLLRPCLEAQRQALGLKNHHTLRTAGHLDELMKARARLAALKGPPGPAATNP